MSRLCERCFCSCVSGFYNRSALHDQSFCDFVVQTLIAHGDADAPLPAFAHGRVHASKLRKDNYAVEYAEFGGGHSLEPAVVAQAVDRFFDRA